VVEGEYQRKSLIEETLSLSTLRRDDVMMLAKSGISAGGFD